MKKRKFTKLAVVFTLLFGGVFAQNGDKQETQIAFTENKGQICDQNYNPRPDVLFSGSANGINYHLTSKGISYQLNRAEHWKEIVDEKTGQNIKFADRSTVYRVDINWLGANENAPIIKGKELAGRNNYYLAQCPNGVTDVRSFENIIYHNIYNGIDLKWYKKNGELEYDFIIEPNANYEQIKIEIKGARKLNVNSKGELEIETPLGNIIEKAPVAFQGNKIIESKWQVINGVASFKLNSYDKTKILIIDPALRKWGTYYGGTLDDYGRGCKTDASGNVFFTGYTANTTTTLIATVGSHQTVFGGGTLDAFLAKFNTSGVRLWSTYYGGVGNDVSLCVEVDGTNEYIGGYSTSTGTSIATVGSHQAAASAGNEGFLAKFDQNGVRVWATFYGGTGSDVINGCAKDASGNIYVAGNSSSNGAIAAGGHQNTYAGGGDGFLVKFNSAGVRLWGTYYGGAGLLDTGMGCATDATGMVYLVGKTQTSTGSAIASGGHQTTFGGSEDGYLAKFSSAGVRQWGTYYGGSGTDNTNSCATDASGNVYIAGQAGSATTTLIATVGSYQTTYGGSGDSYFAKFNSTGVRQWGTYYGANGLDDGLFCTIDANGDLLAVGSTNSPSGISTPGAHQPNLSGGYDGYIACINKSNGQLNWGTYYGGGTGSDYSTGICTDNFGYIFMSGYSNSAVGTWIATTGGHQNTNSGLNDGFLAKFADCPVLSVTIVSSGTICSGQSATLSATGSGFNSYLWNTSATTSAIVVSPSVTTNYSVTAGTSTAACSYENIFTLSVTTTPTVVVTPSTAIHCVGSNSTLITATGATTYSWNTTATTNTILVSPTINTTYTVVGYNGVCANTKTVFLNAWATPTVLVSGTPTQTFCTGNSLTLTAFGASTYTWSNGPLTYSNVVSPTITTNYTVTGSNGQCVDDYVVIVSPVTTPTVNLASSSPSICTGGSATLSASGATTYSWNTSATTPTIAVSPTSSTNYTVTGYNGACVNTKTTNIGISTTITVLALSNPTAICSGSSATLTASGASTYTWNTSSNSISIVVTPTALTTYTVSGNSGSCFGTTTINLNVNPNPTISVASSASVLCVGETATITASGANTYSWNTTDATPVITVTPSSNTSYTVIGTNSFGCSSNSTFTQSVSLCTGVDEHATTTRILTLYPNPTNGNTINIETESPSVLKIYNTLGQIVREVKLLERTSVINISELVNGVYYFSIHQKDLTMNVKVIKQE